MKGVHWVDLGQWPQALAVIADKRAYNRFMRSKGISQPKTFPGRNGGLCQTLERGSNCILVIAIGDQDQDELPVTVAHEATHAMRWILEHVGEDRPGIETEAYLVEHIVRGALKALKAPA